MKKLLFMLLIFSFYSNMFSQEIAFNKIQLKYFFDSTYTGHDSITIFNVGSMPLVIDTLYSVHHFGYRVKIFLKDSSYSWYVFTGYFPLNLSIEPVDSAKLIFNYPDFCPVCKKTYITTFEDQLIIHSNSLTNSYSYISVQGDGSSLVNNNNGTLNSFILYQNYPNPFNPSTTIKVSVESSSEVTLSIFTVSGQEVAILFKGRLNRGSYNFLWNNKNMPSGIYYCRMTAGMFSKTLKLVFLK